MRVAKIAQFADTNKTNPTFFAIARKKCHFTEIMLHKSTKMKFQLFWPQSYDFYNASQNLYPKKCYYGYM